MRDEVSPSTYLHCPVVQALCVLFKLHPYREIQVIVAEGTVGLGLEDITVLTDDLCLIQADCNLAGGKINICL